MALMVFAATVPPAQVAQYHQMLAELNGPRRTQLLAAHRQAGLCEVAFSQPTPDGGLQHISVLEGDDEADTLVQKAFEAILADPDFANWLFRQAREVYGMDISQGMPPQPARVLDTRRS
jgi:hypothetical protein